MAAKTAVKSCIVNDAGAAAAAGMGAGAGAGSGVGGALGSRREAQVPYSSDLETSGSALSKSSQCPRIHGTLKSR